MFRFLFRFVFRVVSIVVLLGIAFGVYHLYTSGKLPYIQRVVEDTAVTGSVKAAFAVHRVFGERPIAITTDRGVVMLSGDVASSKERDAAEELASNVEGVVSVENHLEIDEALNNESPDVATRSLGQRVDDAALLGRIRTALHLDRDMRKIEVDIQVSEGRVMLRGEVATEEIAQQIRTRVASVAGVESLDDELKLGAPH